MLGPEQEVDLGQPSRAMFPHSAIPLSPKLSLSQMSPRPSQRPSPLVPSSEALLPSLVSSPPSITLNTHDRLPNRQTSLNINSTPRLLPCQPSTLDALLQPSMLSVETPTFSPPLKQTLPIPTAELPLDVLAASRRWIYTFALINFDLDEGPGEDRMSAWRPSTYIYISHILHLLASNPPRYWPYTFPHLTIYMQISITVTLALILPRLNSAISRSLPFPTVLRLVAWCSIGGYRLTVTPPPNFPPPLFLLLSPHPNQISGPWPPGLHPKTAFHQMSRQLFIPHMFHQSVTRIYTVMYTFFKRKIPVYLGAIIKTH